MRRDKYRNPTTFFSRKECYALNVQCIVDEKSVLWVSYSKKGDSHDSRCFRVTYFYGSLFSMNEELYRLGYFIFGDSAYAIESFRIPLYNSPPPRTSENDFNFLSFMCSHHC